MGGRRWRQVWPWLLIAAGAGLSFRYARAAWVAAYRESYFSALRQSPQPFIGDAYYLAQRADAVAADRTAALGLARKAFADATTPLERGAAHVLLTRLRAQRGAATEADLASFLDPGDDELLWRFALQQLYQLRMSRGDAEGAAALMEDVVSGRLRHPEHDRIPFQYVERGAAWTLAEHYRALGDGSRTIAWAKRLKYDIAAHVDYPCGNGYRMEHDAIEGLLEDGARLAGLTYAKEPMNRARIARRDFGPPLSESLAGILVGMGVAFIGVCVLTRRAGRWPGRAVGWRFFWSPRGGLATLGWGLNLLAGTLLQLWLGFLAFQEGLPGDPGGLLGMLCTAPLFVAPFIGLMGCLVAQPRADPA